jgi:hypothetical protein
MWEISSGLPTIMPRVVPLPFDEVLVLVAILTAVEDLFDLILDFVIHLHRVWRGWIVPLDFVALPWGQTVHVKNRVLSHKGRKG